MRFLEYNITHPYPRHKLFVYLLLSFFLLLLPVLLLVNIVQVGYELVPALYSEFDANNADPHWWNVPDLPPLLRHNPPPCQPKDIGRGDTFRLTPSLFEYKVLSSWKTNSTTPAPEDEGRIDYQGGSFDQCFIYNMRIDYSILDYTQTVTVGIFCPEDPVHAFLETTLVFADEISKDIVGQYYGSDIDLLSIINGTSRDYRKAVFAILDVISTDSLIIMRGQHTSAPILTMSAPAVNITDDNGPFISSVTITYPNGTIDSYDSNSLGIAEVYRPSIKNLMRAVYHAVMLDLRDIEPDNIFFNQAAVNDTFEPNLAPNSISPDDWVGDANSFYYGSVVAPYQTWAQMLLAGLPKNITLGNLTGLPADSAMITDYLCPSYRRKQTGSFLASLFTATATMILSAWGAVRFITSIAAKRYREPCLVCTCGALLDEKTRNHVRHNHDLEEALPGAAAGLIVHPPVLRTDSKPDSVIIREKDGKDSDSPNEAPVPEVLHYGSEK